MIRVFVYGTLKQGQRNWHYLRDAEFVDRHVTHSRYAMFEFDDYPAVCQDGSHSIHGEIYWVSQQQFYQLDELEQYPDFYQRIEIPTAHGNAWMYIVSRELCHGRKALDGHWPPA
jgi:gamma-glutamylcyclotransferase (GGCT)/AIG2-like uncharacterized protein YtfP